ncbi:Dihydroorotase, partial [hydrothermal vent metagenome]
ALVHEKVLTATRLIETLTSAPAKILGIERGSLSQGSVADVTIIDPDTEWVIDPEKFRSKGKNSPFGGWKVKGRADVTVVKGKVVYEWR